MIELSVEEARRIALSSSLGFRGLPAAKAKNKSAARDASESVFRRSSWIQIDTISVVERAHHHAMWTRNPDYNPDHISHLESPDNPAERKVVEYWSHAAAYIPVEDLRYSLPRMERIRERGHDWYDIDKKLAEEILSRIRDEGAFQSRDFQETKAQPGGWWNWKPAKQALDYMFQAGILFTKTRQGFQKVYDLPERVVPDFDRSTVPDEVEMAAWFLDRAERELGVFQEKDVGYARKDGVSGISAELKARIEAGRIHRTKIPGRKGSWYVTEDALVRLNGTAMVGADGKPGSIETANPNGIAGPAGPTELYEAKPKSGIRILSPFDPYVINRSRLLQLYDFDFVIECYVPEPKRVFGYFALPLLWIDGEGRSHIAGKIDAKAERDKAVLRVNRVAWETSVTAPKRPAGLPTQRVLEEQLAKSLNAFAHFNGAETVVFAGEAGHSRLAKTASSHGD